MQQQTYVRDREIFRQEIIDVHLWVTNQISDLQNIETYIQQNLNSYYYYIDGNRLQHLNEIIHNFSNGLFFLRRTADNCLQNLENIQLQPYFDYHAQQLYSIRCQINNILNELFPSTIRDDSPIYPPPESEEEDFPDRNFSDKPKDKAKYFFLTSFGVSIALGAIIGLLSHNNIISTSSLIFKMLVLSTALFLFISIVGAIAKAKHKSTQER
ncbi:MAG: hypothetical protein LBJ93_03580 [Clostridiales bacterium]|nr:hypothetical protein [Clostridiales bacterium]